MIRASYFNVSSFLRIFMVIVIITSYLYLSGFHFLIAFTNAQQTPQNFQEIVRNLNFSNIQTHVRFFSSLGSRTTGYEGFFKASTYILDKFKQYGLMPGPFGYQQFFQVTVPMDTGSYILDISSGKEIKAYALEPNYVQTCGTPTEGISGRLVYVGVGSLNEMDGKPIKNNIVLMDASGGKNWLMAAQLGAKAIVFISKNPVTSLTSVSLSSYAPIYMPRLFVNDKDSVDTLIQWAKEEKQVKLFSGMRWRTISVANLVGVINGTKNPKEILIIMVHYDAFSFVPALAPGAEDAVATAVFLELARFFSIHKPTSTIWFVALAAHWEGMIGANHFVEQHYFNPSSGSEYQPFLAVSMDFYSDVKTIGPFSVGYYNGMTQDTADGRYAGVYRLTLDVYPKALCSQLNSSVFQLEENGGIISSLGLDPSMWSRLRPSNFFFDAEAVELAGPPGIGFLSTHTYAPYFNTPYDLYEKINWDNLHNQIIYVASCLYGFATAESLSNVVGKSWNYIAPTRRYSSGTNGFGFDKLIVRAMEYNVSSPMFYTPIPNALVVVRKEGGGTWSQRPIPNTYMPRGWIIVQTNKSGIAVIEGVAADVSGSAYPALQAWRINNETQQIEYAPDMGEHGTRGSPLEIIRVTEEIAGSINPIPVFAFRTGTLIVMNLAEPRDYPPLVEIGSGDTPAVVLTSKNRQVQNPLPISIQILNFLTQSPLDSWSYYFDYMSGTLCAFAPPGQKFSILVKTGMSANIAAVLLNSTEEYPMGQGYVFTRVGELLLLDFPTFEIARQMNLLDKARIEIASKYGGISPSAISNHEKASKLINQAQVALSSRSFSQAYALSLLALSYEVQSYDAIKSFYNDLISVTPILYVFLLLFTVFSTKLFFPNGTAKDVALGVILFFMGPLVILYIFHPGFHIASNVWGEITGITIGAVTVPLILVLLSRISKLGAEMRRKFVQLDFSQIQRFDASLMAFSISIENVRKRKARSFLNMFSLVVITTSLISLTAVNFIPAVAVQTIQAQPAYTGFTIIRAFNDPLSEQLVYITQGILSSNTNISVRIWLYPPTLTATSSQTPSLIGLPIMGNRSIIYGIVGLSPNEMMSVKKTLINGRWFNENDTYVCLISDKVASETGLNVGNNLNLLGLEFKVVGIFNSKNLTNIKDLNQRNLAPINPIQYYTNPSTEDTLPLDRVLIIPSKIAITMPGSSIRQITVMLLNQTKAEEVAKNFSLIFKSTYIFCSHGSEIVEYSSSFAQNLFGFEFLIVPLVIGSLVVFDAMLGNFFEKRQEYQIYTSLGLAPFHIAAMLIAESATYGIFAGVIGYLIGLVTSKITKNFLPIGFYPNYYSWYVLLAMGLCIVLSVVASVLPIRIVISKTTPSLEREWKMPTKPRGDFWDIPLPFAWEEAESLGVLPFLKNFLLVHEVAGVGSFICKKVNMQLNERGTTKSLVATIWLPPYEENITQEVIFELVPSELKKVVMVIHIKRISGDDRPWIIGNRFFINDIRKQLLIWGSISLEEKEQYMHKVENKGE